MKKTCEQQVPSHLETSSENEVKNNSPQNTKEFFSIDTAVRWKLLQERNNGKTIEQWKQGYIDIPVKEKKEYTYTPLLVNLEDNSIMYNNNRYEITLPNNIQIAKIDFWCDSIDITGKLSFFQSTISLSYAKFIHILDTITKKWCFSLNSKYGTILIQEKKA